MSNTSSSADDTALQQWRTKSPENEAEYLKVAKVWEHSGSAMETNIDVAAQWESFRNQKFSSEKAVIELNSAKQTTWYKYAAAAVLLIGIILSGIWFNGDSVYKTQANQRLLVALADGTQITLADNTTLSVPRTFNWFTRGIAMDGEGLFKIAKNPEKAFTIKGPITTTKILGTAFRLVATNKQNSIQVAEGKVAYWANNGTDTLILTPGKSAEYSNMILREVLATTTNMQAWFTGNYRFENIPLRDVLASLQDHYAFSLQTEQIAQIADCRFNGTFSKQTKEEVIEELALAMNFTYTWQKNTLVLQTVACN